LESLEWQAEDIRLARGLDDEHRLVTEDDAAYFLSRYDGLRAEHRARDDGHTGAFVRAQTVRSRIRRLNALGYGMLRLGTDAVQASLAGVRSAVTPPTATNQWHSATLRPTWYAQRVQELLGEPVPRATAQRLYEHLLVHKWLLSERAGQDIGLDAAARDWMTQVHRPAVAFLASYLPRADGSTRYKTYLEILDHTWEISQREQRPISFEEGAVDYALAEAH
jgi:hypothetical protein